MLFFVDSSPLTMRIFLPSTERFRWFPLPLGKAIHLIDGVHFLNRLEFMRNLLGSAGALWNCCMPCFRLVESILAPYQYIETLNLSDGSKATDHSSPTSNPPLDDGGL